MFWPRWTARRSAMTANGETRGSQAPRRSRSSRRPRTPSAGDHARGEEARQEPRQTRSGSRRRVDPIRLERRDQRAAARSSPSPSPQGTSFSRRFSSARRTAAGVASVRAWPSTAPISTRSRSPTCRTPLLGCEECLKIGGSLDAPPHVPRLRKDRLLRQLPEPPRDGALSRDRPSAHALRRAPGGLVLVLRRRGRLAARAPVGRAIGVALPLRANRHSRTVCRPRPARR